MIAFGDRHLQIILDSTSDSIITVNSTAQIIGVNSAATRSFGLAAPAFFMLGIDDVIVEVDDDSAQSGAVFSDLLESRANGMLKDVHVLARGLDGREFPAVLTVVPTGNGDNSNRLIFVREITAEVEAVSGDSPREVAFQGTISDISELRATADAIEDSEEHFRALADNTPDIVTVIDAACNVVYCNPSFAEVTGFSRQESVGRSLFETVHPADVDSVRDTVAEGFASPGSVRSFTARHLHADGSEIHMESVGVAFRTARGAYRGVINSRDITQRRRASLQLQQAQKLQAVGQLTGGIAHDFNELLTIIMGNLQLVEEQPLAPEVAVHVQAALRAASEGSELTRRLLPFASGQLLEPKVVRIDRLVAETQASLDEASRNSCEGLDPEQLRGQETVLVVDDNAGVRSSAVATIARMGYDVLSASSGPEALTVLASSDVELLFSDVCMPDMSGFELAARAQAAYPDLRVLLTSGSSDAAPQTTEDERRVYDYIPKPYRKQNLANHIRRILDDSSHE